MLFPIVCFTCGMPIQQHEERYYKLVDNYRAEQSRYLNRDDTQELIADLKRSMVTGTQSFENSVIAYSGDNAKIKELAGYYRYTPEFLALRELGINEKRYCCRRMFLCHPRELGSMVL